MNTWQFAPLHAPSAALVQLGMMALGLSLGLFAVWKSVRGMEKILKMPDGSAFLDALEHFLSEKHSTRAAEMSQPELGFLALRELSRHVRRSGFEGYFRTPSANYLSEALWCLRAIGAARSASLVEEAAAQFPCPVPELTAERCAVMDTLPEECSAHWERLSEEFTRIGDSLNASLNAFVRKNEREFR